MKSRFQVWLATAVIAVILMTVPAHAQTDWWPMFHHDSTTTGYSTTNAPDRGCYKWCLPCGFNILSSPTVDDGKVYAALPDVVCLDAGTGEWIWNYPGVSLASPAVANGMVYIGTYDGDIVCLDAGTGSPNWTYPAGGETFSSATVAYDPYLLQYMVYIGTDYGDILCLDADYGYYYWSYTTGGPVLSTPAVVDTSVYFGSSDGNVYCLDTTNPDPPIWIFPTGAAVLSSPAVTDSAIYVGSFDGSIYCLTPDSGYVNWAYATGDSIWSSPAVAYGNVYVGSRNGNIYCIDAEYPDPPVWVYPTGGQVISSPAVADSVVWVGNNVGGIFCFDAMDGDLIWSNTLDFFVGASPAIVDTVVYVSSSHYIYALGEQPTAFDVAVTDVNLSRTAICRGDSISIDVTVENLSLPCSVPISLSCVLYYDNLAEPTPEQIETFRGMGDLNGEGFIDSADVALMAYALGSIPGDCNWVPYADLSGDDIVDLEDLSILGMYMMMYYDLDIWTHFGLGGPLPIAKRSVFEMEPWTTEIVSFEWMTAGVGLGAHTVSAYVSYVPNEINTEDNDGPTVPVTLVSTFNLTITATEGQTTIPMPGTYPCPCNADTIIEAVPDFWFSYWTLDGDSMGTVNPCSLFMDDDHSLHAVFKSPCGDDVPTVLKAFALHQNVPNPFNPTTTIRFDLPHSVHVKLCIYNVKGELIASLVNQHMTEGHKKVSWSAKDNRGLAVTSGIYFYRLVAGDFVQTRKMVLLK
ncbi:MAG: PQQ-binding-like beta-propeller repeat protein [bacterium]|nr:MAG: PQQ-binding-like beta-propeller repeat protein [bacterium]